MSNKRSERSDTQYRPPVGIRALSIEYAGKVARKEVKGSPEYHTAGQAFHDTLEVLIAGAIDRKSIRCALADLLAAEVEAQTADEEES